MITARAFIVMMSKNKAKLLIRALAVAFWAFLWWKGASWFMETGMDWRHLPHGLRLVMRHAGHWGPLVLLAAYLLRTFLFLPSSVLEIAAGSLYGPVFGTLLNILGANLSAALAFGVGRLLGREYLSKREHGRLKAYDEALTRDGFTAMLVIRLLFVPFDVVSYGAGMTGMKFKDYAWGTFLGTLPAILAFTIAGDSLGKPRGFLVFIALAAAIVGLVLVVKRHPWAKLTMFRKHHE